MMSLGGCIFAAYLMALAAMSPCPPLLGSQSGVALVVSNCISLLSRRRIKNESLKILKVLFATPLNYHVQKWCNCLVCLKLFVWGNCCIISYYTSIINALKVNIIIILEHREHNKCLH